MQRDSNNFHCLYFFFFSERDISLKITTTHSSTLKKNCTHPKHPYINNHRHDGNLCWVLLQHTFHSIKLRFLFLLIMNWCSNTSLLLEGGVFMSSGITPSLNWTSIHSMIQAVRQQQRKVHPKAPIQCDTMTCGLNQPPLALKSDIVTSCATFKEI